MSDSIIVSTDYLLQKTMQRLRNVILAHRLAFPVACFSAEPIKNLFSPPKKRVLMSVGYVGVGYSGSQAQPQQEGTDTIEGTLINALVKAGYIRESNRDPRKVGLKRSSRTDKSVHSAGGLVLSLKIHLMRDDCNRVLHDVNQHLPSDIRVFAVRKTRGGFNPRTACRYRTYEYLIPGHAMEVKGRTGGAIKPACTIEELNIIMQEFVGPRNVHNFRAGDAERSQAVVSFPLLHPAPEEIYRNSEIIEFATKQNPTNTRHLLSIELDPIPISFESGATSTSLPLSQAYFKLRLVGVSFVYHQIRYLASRRYKPILMCSFLE